MIARDPNFELNLAPVIDCFTVLIAFVMISSAFASIGVFDASLSAAGKSAASDVQEPIKLKVTLRGDRSYRVEAGDRAVEIQALKGDAPGTTGISQPDRAGLAREMLEIKRRWPELKTATLVADDRADYQDVVASLESMRRSVRLVALGGF